MHTPVTAHPPFWLSFPQEALQALSTAALPPPTAPPAAGRAPGMDGPSEDLALSVPEMGTEKTLFFIPLSHDAGDILTSSSRSGIFFFSFFFCQICFSLHNTYHGFYQLHFNSSIPPGNLNQCNVLNLFSKRGEQGRSWIFYHLF